MVMFSKFLGCVFSVSVLLICGIDFSSDCNAQDAAKQQIELLEAKLSLAEKTLELLEKECEELRKENARLKADKDKSMNEEGDQFAPGVVWVGEAKTANKPPIRWAISVSERDGRKLAGVIALTTPDGRKVEQPISGTAPATGNGLVVIETPLIGRGQMFMRGRINSGEIALAFSGTTPLGDKHFGSATLRPKN